MQTEGSQPPWTAPTVPANPKGKATAPASFTSKIARSVSGLAKEVVGSSDAAELSQKSHNTLGLGSKLQNGTSSQSPQNWLQDIPSYASPFNSSGNSASALDSFRSSPKAGLNDHEFDEFMNGSPGEGIAAHLERIEHPGGEPRFWPSLDHALPIDNQSLFHEDYQESHIPGHPNYQDDIEDAAETQHTIALDNDTKAATLPTESQHLERRDNNNTSEALSLKRLNMILGHVTEAGHLAYSRKFALDTRAQEHMAIRHMAPETLQGMKMAHNYTTSSSSAQHHHSNGIGHAHSPKYTSPTTHDIKHHQEKKSPETIPEESKSEFRCTRSVCQHRYNDPDAIRPFPGARWGYVCPHEGCTTQFQTFDKWNQHIMRPHHGLP